MLNNNFWSNKPLWCQPWTIVLFGLTLIISTFFFVKVLWLTILVAFIVILWWFLFLYLAPNLYYRDKLNDLSD